MKNQNPNPNSNPKQYQSCAACNHQRKKCREDCELAAYFPRDSQAKFVKAHKLFGIGNMLKVIRSLPHKSQKDIAMKTMLIQSDLRDKDPVLGCLGCIMNLQKEIAANRNELNLVLRQIDYFRAAAMNHRQGYQERGNFEQQYRLVNQGVDESRLIKEEGQGALVPVLEESEFFNGIAPSDRQFFNGNGFNTGYSSENIMMMKEEECQDALVPVLEEREFFNGQFFNGDGFNIGCSSANIRKQDEPGDGLALRKLNYIRR